MGSACLLGPAQMSTEDSRSQAACVKKGINVRRQSLAKATHFLIFAGTSVKHSTRKASAEDFVSKIRLKRVSYCTENRLLTV
jgi:hypothetical protein